MRPPIHEVVVGDVREVLKGFPDRSVQCIITSPPYWGLRDYGVAGQIGSEATPGDYVATLVGVFREARRVLRDDGTLWLNLGDTYAANRSYQAPSTKGGPKHSPSQGFDGSAMRVPDGLKPKDLVGIPWSVALALRADGWYLRADCIWAKGTSGQKAMREEVAAAMLEEGVVPDVVERVLARWEPYVGNCMPSSVEDRPTSAHEYVFLLSKSETYYYDHVAVREPFADARQGRDGLASERNRGGRTDGYTKPNGIDPSSNGGRNMRTVWTIPPEPFPGAHFATFPTALVTPCIRAGTSKGGCCAAPACGAPLERVVERGEPDEAQKAACGADATGGYSGESTKDHAKNGVQDASAVKARVLAGMAARVTTGWRRTCGHGDEAGVQPCLVADIFCGSGTVGVVARREGRDFVGIELNPEFAAMAEERITNPNYAREERARQRARREAEKNGKKMEPSLPGDIIDAPNIGGAS